MEGIKSVISIGQESSYGTAVTPTLSIPVLPSDGIQPNQELISVEGIRGTAPKNKRIALGKRSYEGGFEMPIYPNSIGYFLQSIFGTSTPTEIESGTVYKHTFTEAIAKKSLTIEQQLAGISTRRYAGFVVDSIKFSGKVNELITASITGKAKSTVEDTAITPSFETSRAFNFKDVLTLSIGGTDIKAKIEDFEFEYNIGLELFHGLGSNDPVEKYVKQSEVNGKITCYLDSTTKAYFDDLITGTEKELILDIIGDTIGSTANNELKFIIPKANFSKFESKLDFGYTAVALEFMAREDETNGLIKAELINVIANY